MKAWTHVFCACVPLTPDAAWREQVVPEEPLTAGAEYFAESGEMENKVNRIQSSHFRHAFRHDYATLTCYTMGGKT